MAWLGRSKEKASETQPAAAVPSADIERRTAEIGRDLLKSAREYQAGILSARFWNDQLMNWAMKDPNFKVQLFRFIDVFPMLRTPALVHDYLTDYLSQPGVTLPPGMDLGLKVGGLVKGVTSKFIANRITAMASNFMAGVDAASALPYLKKLWDEGVAFSVDLLGEACLSDEEVVAYQRRYLDLIETLPKAVGEWKPNPLLETDYLGPIPRTNVSIKISSLCARTDPIAFEGSLDALTESLRPILEAAAKNNVMIAFDMEQAAFKDLTLTLFERCCEAVDFPATLAVQADLRSGEQDIQRVIAWAKRSGRQVTVRLIKGAYWDYETINAERMGWPVPVWSEKRETDACFERMAQRIVEAMPRGAGEGGVKLATGSHNIRSIAFILALLEKHGLPDAAYETQKLSGMGDQLRAALSQRGMRIREYAPVGEMIPGMAYFVRRLLENTSNQSWLRAGFSDEVSDEVLLASPHVVPSAAAATPRYGDVTVGAAAARRHTLAPAVDGLGDGLPMINEPMHDFSQLPQREKFTQAVAKVKVPAIARTVDADGRGRPSVWRPRHSPPGATAIRSSVRR